jgi:hypothetical protein
MQPSAGVLNGRTPGWVLSGFASPGLSPFRSCWSAKLDDWRRVVACLDQGPPLAAGWLKGRPRGGG